MSAGARSFSADELRELLTLYSADLRARPQAAKAARIVSTLTAPEGEDPAQLCYLDSVAAKAGKALAALIDDMPTWHNPRYHNVSHYLDVAATSFVFAPWVAAHMPEHLRDRLGLSQENISDCFIAGLIHDMAHPGGNNGGAPFKLERRSWEMALPILEAAGYSGERAARMKRMIFGTDPIFGVPAVNLAMRLHEATAEEESAIRAQIGQFKSRYKNRIVNRLTDFLIDDITTAAMSYILTKADIFCSLMPEFAFTRTMHLQQEHDEEGTGVRFFNADGTLDLAGHRFFTEEIADVVDKRVFALGLDAIFGATARKLKMAWAAGSAPVRRQSPASRREIIPRL